MLVPITRVQFEQLVPIVATGAQYKYCWGKFADFLRRLIISILGICLIYFSLHWLFPDESEWITLLPVIIAGLYWWWEPIVLASRRNWQSRQVPYSGFWRGEVLDVYITDKLIGERESVDNKGNLVIIEDLETRLNLELGDETGFSTKMSVPFKKAYKSVYPGQIVEAIVMSYRPDLSSFAKVSDLYLPDLNLWLSDYPCVRRDAFVEMSRKIDDDVYEDDYYEPPAPRSRRRA
jgi:hypothetical protein